MNERPNLTKIAFDLASKLCLSDSERIMIEDAMKSVYEQLPNSKSGASALINGLLSHKSNIYYVKSSLQRRRGSIYREYRTQIDNKFTILTRQGRPSREAIHSEIHSQSGDLRAKRDVIDELDEAIDILDMVISMIDSKMRIVDSKRFDLGDA